MNKIIKHVFLWIDDNINHEFVDTFFSQFDNDLSFWLWENISHRFCLWVCDNFEDFEDTPHV